jgi:hypothetical protein
MTQVKGVKDSRRGEVAVLAWALARCWALPFNNPTGRARSEVSQEQLLPQENRIATELDVDTVALGLGYRPGGIYVAGRGVALTLGA